MNDWSSAAVITRLDLLALVDAALLAVAATLTAIIPAFVELARIRVSSFLAGEDDRSRLRVSLRLLSAAIAAFGLALVASLAGYLLPCVVTLIVASVPFAIGLITLMLAGLLLATTVVHTV